MPQVGAGSPQQLAQQIIFGRTTAIAPNTQATVPPNDNSYEAEVFLNATSAATGTVIASVRYTDSSNTVQTVQLASINTAVLGSASASGGSHFFKAKGGTAIQLLTTITGTPTYDIAGALFQISDR